MLQVKTSFVDFNKVGNHSSIELPAKSTEQGQARQELVVGELGELAEWF
jgi:hypothetical protein